MPSSDETFSKRLRKFLGISVADHSVHKAEIDAQLSALTNSRQALEVEQTRMHLALDDVATQLRSVYGP